MLAKSMTATGELTVLLRPAPAIYIAGFKGAALRHEGNGGEAGLGEGKEVEEGETGEWEGRGKGEVGG